MSQRKRLTIVLSGLVVIGMVLAAIPFIRSMNPSARAEAALPYIDVSSLSPGSFSMEKMEGMHYFEDAYLLLRDYDQQLYVYLLSLHEGKVLLPDIHWFRFGGLCEKFSPEMENGKLKRGGTIKCHDKLDNNWWAQEWRWSYDGKNLGKSTDDLVKPKYSIKGDYLTIGRR